MITVIFDPGTDIHVSGMMPLIHPVCLLIFMHLTDVTGASCDLLPQALYSYTALHSDELTFQEGELLELTEKVDGGSWWRATYKGQTGLAPANYIELIKKPVVQNFRDRVQESDEWDSSDEEGGASSNGSITYYFNGAARSVEVPVGIISKPNYISLYRAIQ